MYQTGEWDMDAYSWFRRSVSRLKKSSLPSTTTGAAVRNKIKEEELEKLHGVNEKLIEFIKSFSLETFKNFSLPDEEESSGDGGNPGNVQKDLSEWQETHAMLVLSRVKELAQLRFQLCPRYMKERQFWRIYFTLVRSYVTEYELRAVQLARLKQMSTENDNVSSSGAYEVEMSEAKFPKSIESEALMEHK